MDNPASALSSTVEEPPPEPVTDATDDASHRAPDTLASRSSSSSSGSSSFSSVSCEDAFEARNRQFPPLLPSTNRPDRRDIAALKIAKQLASLSRRTPAARSPAADSDSATDDLSSEGEEEDPDGEEDDSDDDEDDGDDDDEDGNKDSDVDVDVDDQDSFGAGEDDEDEDSRVQSLWIKLRDQRSAVRRLRLELSDKRKRLRELRRKKDDADNRFMGMVRPYLVASNGLPSPGEVIIRQFEAMQKESNEYHDEEAEVEQLEAELDREELSRETLETQFFTILYEASGESAPREESPPRSLAESYGPPSRASLLGIPADRPVDIHPLYTQLLDAVGDRELAKEHHTDLMMHRDLILYDLRLTIKRERLRETEGRPGKNGALSESDDLELVTAIARDPKRLNDLEAKYRTSIGRDNEEFLLQFADEEAMLEDRLKETINEVEKLRQLCIDKGVMRKNAPYHEEYTIFSDTGEPIPGETLSIGDDPPPKREEPLANPRFPILLSNPRHVLEHPMPLTPRGALRAATRLPSDRQERPHLVAGAMKEYGISTLVVESAAENKSDYINRWLLQRLRISPLEVELLFTIFSSTLKVKNIRRWEEDVLYYWSRDEANKAKEDYDGPVTTRDALIIDDDFASEGVNSALAGPDRPGSDPGDSPKQARGHQRPRSLQSVC